MMRDPWIFAAAALMLSGPALADTLYSNTSNCSCQSQRVADSSNNNFVAAMSFNSGMDTEFTDLMVALYVNGAYGAVNDFYLYTDSLGAPGTQVGLIGEINDSQITPGVFNVFYDLGPNNLALTQNTKYWVVDQYNSAASKGVQEIYWTGNAISSGTGVSGQTWLKANGTGWATVNSYYAQMVVTGTSSVPEPGTFVIGSAGLLTIAFLRRRRR